MDVAHVAKLANLPLSREEEARMADECRAVLGEFTLPEGREAEPAGEPCPTFDDEPEPWPADGVRQIVDGFPKKDGRLLKA